MSSSKKFTCEETLRQGFICVRPRTPPPPYTLLRVYNILIHTGKGGGLNQGEGGAAIFAILKGRNTLK
jgi:hypothetical protein